MYVDLGYWAISGSIHPKGHPRSWGINSSVFRWLTKCEVVKQVLGMPGRNIMIFSKIESEEGIDNFDEILEVLTLFCSKRDVFDIFVPTFTYLT